jgi:MEMO1 family protein
MAHGCEVRLRPHHQGNSMRRRIPAVAGLFYPDDPTKIEAFVRPYVGPVGEKEGVRFYFGPHAGYVYSGAIAGEGYARVRVPDSVVIMGPNHTGFGHPQAVYAQGVFAMPSGDIAIDEELAASLIDTMGLVDDERAHRQEHCIEVHLPFLYGKNPNVKIVPICLGHLSFEACENLGRGLASVLRKRDDVLVVVSTDMSHYVTADEASRLDKLALDQLVAVEPRALFDTVRLNDISMCGFIPTTVALVAARELGLTKGELIRYGNSGETSGDYHRVVGYAAAMVS